MKSAGVHRRNSADEYCLVDDMIVKIRCTMM